MASRAFVCRDPARREELLSLLRLQPRRLVHELAAAMQLSDTSVRDLLRHFIDVGVVLCEFDPSRRCSVHSTAPRVYWVNPGPSQPTPEPALLPPRAPGLPERPFPVRCYPYAHTGTPVEHADGVQVLAIEGRLR